MSPLDILLVLFSLNLRTTRAAASADLITASKDNSPSCGCYEISSDSSPVYFTYHRFYDWRNLASSPDQFTSIPPSLEEDEDLGAEELADTYQDVLNGTEWNQDWGIMSWGKETTVEAPVRMQNSAANVYIAQRNAAIPNTSASDVETPSEDIEPYTTHLALRTTRHPTFQSTAEIENQQKNLLHASVRFRARITGDPGAVAGLFTFVDDTNESDIEILTSDAASTIRYSNQPTVDSESGEEIPGSSLPVTGLGSWREWRTHRIDWLPGRSTWYMDEELVARSEYSVPRKPSGLVMNLWSDGGSWSGNMSVGAEALMQVLWVQVVFNVSGPVGGMCGEEGCEGGKRKRGEDGCTVVCRVDGVQEVGVPEVAFRVSAASIRLSGPGSWIFVVAAVMVSILGL
ncbi:hypothetical protein W97_06653 [Coniosporium apollinis CBS 100218]|uniref:GH16 domain-containing protein n=1 Tax=Coniosporium apollinis (strain CBS 100218) TaxID=1168221 RepID=R7YZL1_CONA1|nr:uncharacterized protein W97_06653 [Coniosporium apollinis CBS 100218]EON67400.1 hypothetical protein W97_06653 [Coniosporium apollinis CBS 100218]